MRIAIAPVARWLPAALLAALLAAAFALRADGVRWPRQHHDEHAIAEWLRAGAPADCLYANGFFVVVRPLYRLGEWAAPRVPGGAGRAPLDTILFVRLFNVAAGTLTVLFVYLAARALTGARWAALLAAALVAFNHYHVEHSHYGETDIPMVMWLSLGAWLWVRSLNRPRFAYTGLAALALGMAAGTKFMLVAALPPLVADAAVRGWQSAPHRRAARAAAWAAGAAALAALAMVATNPAMLDGMGFLERVAFERFRLSHETALVMGQAAGVPRTQQLTQARDLALHLRSLAAGGLVLVTAGLVLAWRPPMRRAWALLLAYPALYTVYWVFLAPWVRSQEFLNYLPAFALAAAGAAHAAWRTARPATRAGVLVLATAALLPGARWSLLTTSAFARPGMRECAAEWIARHAPAEAVVAQESFAESVKTHKTLGVFTVAEEGIGALRERGAGYLLRNASAVFTRLTHPLTHQWFEPYGANFRDFEASAERLFDWSLLPPRQTVPTFVTGHVQLWGLDPTRPPRPAGIALSRPAWIAPGRDVTEFPAGEFLGSGTALRLGRGERRLAIGGPLANDGTVYLVLHSVGQPAGVTVRGFGQCRRVRLGASDAAVVALRRAWWRPRLSHVEVVSLRLDRRDAAAEVYARAAFSDDDAIRMLDDLGAAGAAGRHFEAADVQRARDPVRRAAWAAQAGAAYDAFARIRLPDSDVALVPAASGTAEGRADLELLAPPRTVRIELKVARLDAPGHEPTRVVLRVAGAPPVEVDAAAAPAATAAVLPLPGGNRGPVTVAVSASEPMNVRFLAMEARWDLPAAAAARE